MASFCTQCGAAIETTDRFCVKCGKAVENVAPEAPEQRSAVSSPPPPPLEATRPEVPPVPGPHPTGLPPSAAPAPKKSNFAKVVVIILGVLALILVLIIGSCVYLAYRVNQKVTQYAADLKGGLGQDHSAGLSKYETRPIQNCPDRDRTGFDNYMAAAASASIPLKNGLTLIDIRTDPNKGYRDEENLQTVKGVHRSTIEISAVRLEPNNHEYTRTLCIADLLHAREYDEEYGMDVPTTIPGATLFSMSQDVFQDLKAGRPAALNFIHFVYGEKHTEKVRDNKGSLSRVEPNDVPYSAIVNGERKDLPAIHARVMLGGLLYEAWVLDDPANPITLNLTLPARQRHITFVKINFPVEKKIEQDLAQNGRAEIYGIYFDFNSATLRSESGPVLKEISDALIHNPAWKIRIEGHTDNVGGNDYNLGLSQRRAEAVKQALTTQFHITTDRMSPQGFGASRPKATNDTVEGRALNRRVELVRE